MTETTAETIVLIAVAVSGIGLTAATLYNVFYNRAKYKGLSVDRLRTLLDRVEEGDASAVEELRSNEQTWREFLGATVDAHSPIHESFFRALALIDLPQDRR